MTAQDSESEGIVPEDSELPIADLSSLSESEDELVGLNEEGSNYKRSRNWNSMRLYDMPSIKSKSCTLSSSYYTVSLDLDGFDRNENDHEDESDNESNIRPHMIYAHNKVGFNSYSSFSSLHTSGTSMVTSNSLSESSYLDTATVLGHHALSLEGGGSIGLNNLGNTCFLNSTLQCLLSCDELSYELAKLYEKDSFNVKTEEFTFNLAKLFHEMWQDRSIADVSSLRRFSVDPRQFKSALGRVDSRFSGYHQEDSQEALSIILDKLHEDLKKMRLDQNAYDMMADSIVTQDSDKEDGWLKYVKKEDSLVMRLFHGQLKSTLTCSNCFHKSETFEPFSFLNLPIPQPVNTNPYHNRKFGIEREMHHNFDIDSILFNNVPLNGNQIENPYSYSYNPYAREQIVKSERLDGPFNIFCYNDQILGLESSYLLLKRTFKSLNEFRNYFRGSGIFILKFYNNNTVERVYTQLPKYSELTEESAAFIAYRLDMTAASNFLISFESEATGLPIGIPVLFNNNINSKTVDGSHFYFDEFMKSYLKEVIYKIVKLRYPSKFPIITSIVSSLLQEGCSQQYFQVHIGGSVYGIKEVKVIILEGFNELLEEKIGDICDYELILEDLIKDLTYVVNNESSTSTIPNTVIQTDHHCDINYNVHKQGVKESSDPDPESGSNGDDFGKSTITLEDCLKKLLSSEHLSDCWKCDGCKETVRVEKKLDLWRVPEILVLHLKRFSYETSLGYFSYGMSSSTGGSKIRTAIDFDLEINIHCTRDNGTRNVGYKLFAISQHFGSLNYGHYTAIVWHRASKTWKLADDSSVKDIPEFEENIPNANEVKESAYVLFYRKIKN